MSRRLLNLGDPPIAPIAPIAPIPLQAVGFLNCRIPCHTGLLGLQADGLIPKRYVTI